MVWVVVVVWVGWVVVCVCVGGCVGGGGGGGLKDDGLSGCGGGKEVVAGRAD